MLLGLVTGLAYGSSDFLGGLAARRATSALAVVVAFLIVTLGVFAAAVPFVADPTNASAVWWGAAAGAALGVGYVAYFRALAAGPMGVVSTVTAVGSALVPVVAGVALGERPGWAAWVGIAVIVASIPLAARMRGPRAVVDAIDDDATAGGTTAGGAGGMRVGGVVGGAISGVAFGFSFVGLDRSSAAGDGGAELAWPLLAVAATATAVVGAFAIVRRSVWTGVARQWPLLLGAGVLYAAGTCAFIVGTSRGYVSIMAVVAALSPIPTMLLARTTLGERLAVSQYVGIALGIAGVGLLTLAS